MAITEQKLAAWVQKHDLKKLHKALKEYDYKVRISAARHLGHIKNRESLPHLEHLIDDSFLSVLQEVHDAIKAISPSHSALTAFKNKIAEKEQLEEKRRKRTEENFTPNTEEEERQKLEEAAKRVTVARIYQEGTKEQERQMNHWKWAAAILLIVAFLITILRFL